MSTARRSASARPTALGVLLLLGLTGCASTQPKPPSDVPPLSYPQLRELYNRRAEKVPQVWARAVVEINYTDGKGKAHFEQGDGHLLLRKPADLALDIGKLGNVFYFIGGDATRFWYFDLHSDPSFALVGNHADIGKPGMPELPLPIRPDRLVQLMGVNALPDPQTPGLLLTREDSPAGPVDVVRFPFDPANPTLVERIVIDGVKHVPTTITLLDGGQKLAEAQLGEYNAMKLTGAPPGAFPDIATRIAVSLPAQKATLKLFLSDAFDGKPTKVRDEKFNFDQLVQDLAPQKVRTLTPR
jgi:hypothetical protein